MRVRRVYVALMATRARANKKVEDHSKGLPILCSAS
jgi:hypothetical protein